MKKQLLGMVSLALFATGNVVFAADMPVKAPLPAVAAWSWTGCYIGVNAGVDQGRHHADLSPSGIYRNVAPGAAAPPNIAGTGDFPADVAALSTQYSSTNSSFEAGAQIGCNLQSGVMVWGVEADWQWTGVKSTIDAAFASFPNVGNPGFTDAARTEHVDISKKWFGTARARVGFTPWDRVMLYGTAGFAWANYQSNTAVTFATFPGALGVYSGAVHIGSASSTQIGGVVGGGVEWAFMNNWTAKIEYLYMWFNGFNYASPLVAAAVAAAPGYSWNTTVTPREQVIRVGVNYKF